MKFRFSRAPATAALLAIITIVFLFEVATGAIFNNNALLQMGAIIPMRHMIASGQYWRLATGMFLHAGWLHWAANCWALYQLGSLYEVMFGTRRFLLTYVVTGLCASIASSIYQNGTSVGASGAVLGILGAFFFSIRRSPQWRHEPWTKSLLGQLVFWAVVNLAIGHEVPNIDNAAHIGGLVSGLLIGLLPHRVPPPPPGRSVVDVQPYDGNDLTPRQNQP